MALPLWNYFSQLSKNLDAQKFFKKVQKALGYTVPGMKMILGK